MEKLSYDYYGKFEDDEEYPQVDVPTFDLWRFYVRYLNEKKAVWSARANCRDVETEVMFPVRYGKAQKVARDICLSCRVQRECLFFSLVNKEKDGVWGGCTTRERNVLIRKTEKTLGYKYDETWTYEAKSLIQTLAKRVCDFHEKVFTPQANKEAAA